jgi:hypothetical protein
MLKSEYRISKSETNPNNQMTKIQNFSWQRKRQTAEDHCFGHLNPTPTLSAVTFGYKFYFLKKYKSSLFCNEFKVGVGRISDFEFQKPCGAC